MGFNLIYLQTKEVLQAQLVITAEPSNNNERFFSEDYVDLLNEAGCRLEKTSIKQ